MTSLTPDFSSVRSTCDVCGSSDGVERHHLKRELLFIHLLRDTKLSKTEWYEKLKARYSEFRPYDVRPLCTGCHKAIHNEYNQVLRVWNKRRRWKRSIRTLKIEEIESLMTLFRRTYFEWREWKRSKLKKRRGKR